jgi:hypothetical protein
MVEGYCWFGFGCLHLEQGDRAAAIANLIRSLRIRQQIEDTNEEATVFQHLAVIAIDSGKPLECLELCVLAQLLVNKTEILSSADMISMHRAAQQRGLPVGSLATLVNRVAAQYEADAGWGLVRRAFGEIM